MVYYNNNKESLLVLERVKKYLKNNNISSLSNGSYKIEGDDFYVNIFEYDTKEDNECIWEAHRQYYDVHFIIAGEEVIQIGIIETERIDFYDKEKDYVALTSMAHSRILCRSGDLLFLDRNDAHLTGSMVKGHSSHVRKAVFKIRIK